MRRLLKWCVVLGILFGIGAVVTTRTQAWLKQSSLPKYLTGTVSRGRVETVVNSTGTIKPVRTVSVGAFTSGPIKEVFVDFNSEITEPEQLLARIDDRLPAAAVERDRAAVATQEADLKRINALLEQAERNETRANNLRKINPDYLSDTDLDQYKYTTLTLKAQRDLSQASIRQAEATLTNSRDQLNYTKILGPKEIGPRAGANGEAVRGMVLDRKVDPGQTVAASFQTPELFTIALDMDKHMHVYASVDEADIGMIQTAWKQGRRAKFTVDAHPGELFEGHIHDIRLNSTTTQNVVTYPVIIDAPNQGRKLKPGMTASISFQIEEKANVLRIPAAALRFIPQAAQVRAEDRHYLEALPTGKNEAVALRSASEKADQAKKRQKRIVWVQDGTTLRAIPVTLGLIDNQFAEVVEGEVAEDQVVVIGTDNVK